MKFPPIATGETKSFAGTRRPLVASGTVGPGLGWGEMRPPYPPQPLQRWEEPTSQPSLTTWQRPLLQNPGVCHSSSSRMPSDLSRTQGFLASPETLQWPPNSLAGSSQPSPRDLSRITPPSSHHIRLPTFSARPVLCGAPSTRYAHPHSPVDKSPLVLRGHAEMSPRVNSPHANRPP